MIPRRRLVNRAATRTGQKDGRGEEEEAGLNTFEVSGVLGADLDGRKREGHVGSGGRRPRVRALRAAWTQEGAAEETGY